MVSEPVDPTVLVVDDERKVADAYTLRIRDRYEVETTYGGEEALELIDPETDVVLLDRRMPRLSGDEVLRRIRDRGIDCRVIILTAVDPGFDILDMPFDDYLCKPVDRENLFDAIDQQLRIIAYNKLTEYFELVSKRSVLEAEMPQSKIQNSEQYETIENRIEELERRLRGLLGDFGRIKETFDSIDREA
jgi:DNA-binding response OmpR family regulator